MSNLLIGDELSEHVFILNKRLQASTFEGFEEISGLTNIPFSPWMCSYPVAINKPSIALLNRPNGERGGLITDPEYLAEAREFMAVRVPGSNALPGDRTDWLPIWEGDERALKNFDEGKKLLLTSSQSLARLFSELIDFVMPLGAVHRGYSSHFTRGIIYRGFPHNWNSYDIAIDLAHEVGHHTLIMWQSVDPILKTDPYAPVFSAVRQVTRPAIQSFHGAVALSFMLYFVSSFLGDSECQKVRVRHGSIYFGGKLETALEAALELLHENCEFTPIGGKMMDEMAALLLLERVT